MTMHVCQPALDAVVIDGERFMIDAEQMEDRGVEVVAGGRIPGGLPGKLIALTMGDTRLDARASKPRDKGAAVVIATNAALGEWHAAKFRGPDQKRVV